MSFDKNYPNRKDWRKPYRRRGQIRSCRPHGGCLHCEENRTHFDTIHRLAADDQLNQFMKGEEV